MLLFFFFEVNYLCMATDGFSDLPSPTQGNIIFTDGVTFYLPLTGNSNFGSFLPIRGWHRKITAWKMRFVCSNIPIQLIYCLNGDRSEALNIFVSWVLKMKPYIISSCTCTVNYSSFSFYFGPCDLLSQRAGGLTTLEDFKRRRKHQREILSYPTLFGQFCFCRVSDPWLKTAEPPWCGSIGGCSRTDPGQGAFWAVW